MLSFYDFSNNYKIMLSPKYSFHKKNYSEKENIYLIDAQVFI